MLVMMLKQFWFVYYRLQIIISKKPKKELFISMKLIKSQEKRKHIHYKRCFR